MFKKVSLVAAITLLGFCNINAQIVDPTRNTDYLGRMNAITTAVPFLLIAPDSRGGAMGDIGAATSADANSQHYNPAKNIFNKNKMGVSVSYSPWLNKLVQDINLCYVGAYLKITDLDAIAFSLRYFSLGDITFTSEGGYEISTQRPNEFAIDFTYNRKLIDQLSMAITPRFIYSDLTARQYSGGLETKPGIAGAADISLFYEQDFKSNSLENQTLRAGLNISNIGNKMSYSDGTDRRDFISTNLKLGVGYTMEFDEYNSLAIACEFNKLLVPTQPVYATDSLGKTIYDESNNPVIESGRDPNVSVPMGMIQSFYDAPGGFREELREINWAIGIEYAYNDLLFVRAGYFNEHKNKGNRKFFTVGAGIRYNILGIDVSYLFAVSQHHPLENTLRFTLSFDFVSFNKNDIKNQRKFK
ncbi:type IX secretion system outer membrane channel protein PorV [Bacteroidales bacterium OttesenSCG-928-B11]|nr:type IX secretion system outer membrane channel protein PorV [Bacteroidales bacterium OttesenSCG-928-C03]MDL2313066.1 type IX secretion system outer membrane channel protein PorV [Bacteroidales bacterium OttesenSCG-928-B11]